jgi:hypothetical protein
MNDNAFNKKSSIKVKKTLTGPLHDSVGFSKTDGPITPLDEQLKEMEKNGYLVERTPNGIIITKKVK